MLLILQMMMVLTIPTPNIQGETAVQLQSNTINDLVPIATHSDLGATETRPGRFFFSDESGHAFLSADGSSQTSAGILERLRELLRITHRKLRRIRHGSSIAMGVATDRERRFGIANGPSAGPFIGSANFRLDGVLTRTDPRIANRFEIDPIRPCTGRSQCWRSNPVASQWMKPSSQFRMLGQGPRPVHWWHRG